MVIYCIFHAYSLRIPNKSTRPPSPPKKTTQELPKPQPGDVQEKKTEPEPEPPPKKKNIHIPPPPKKTYIYIHTSKPFLGQAFLPTFSHHG